MKAFFLLCNFCHVLLVSSWPREMDFCKTWGNGNGIIHEWMWLIRSLINGQYLFLISIIYLVFDNVSVVKMRCSMNHSWHISVLAAGGVAGDNIDKKIRLFDQFMCLLSVITRPRHTSTYSHPPPARIKHCSWGRVVNGETSRGMSC